MSQEAAPDPTGAPEGDDHPQDPRPSGPDQAGAAGSYGDGPAGCAPSARAGATVDADPEDSSAADEEGLRWAALLAAFINDMQMPPAGQADEPLSPSAD
ncbi:hypothetical protein [Streptomyces sp. NPDC058629]|uniref:hypothetical protein n=1 Tax=Streptomyces sp. NPDC058629 TaxID=3346565 RepID=UPI0036560EE3